MTVQDVAKELKLDWHTAKSPVKEYMQKQLQRNPVAAPRVIGIDEVSLRKGHTSSDSGERFGEEPAHLVWRCGSFS